MTDYNDGKWHPIPSAKPDCIHDKTEVEMVWLVKDVGRITHETRPASGFTWPDGDVTESIAFRVVKEYREPREFWIVLKIGSGKPPEVFGTEPTSVYMAGIPTSWQVIHVREVQQ